MRERLERELSGRYAIERELGRGGMACVWLAHDRRDARPVAIKVLDADLAGAIGADRFVREVRLTTRLQHPGIVPVLDSGVLP
ncbi:MAG TPA: serine/threonine protein kinase, partial [Gemmatimonadaceae bacterium]|nr:serine/threonine protein kinase [Gemmatimonadaceae bacterium]